MTAECRPLPAAILAKASLIWMASSRVGLSTRAHAALPVCQPLDEGQHEGERLAGARLGGGDDVAAGKSRFNRKGLHRCRCR